MSFSSLHTLHGTLPLYRCPKFSVSRFVCPKRTPSISASPKTPLSFSYKPHIIPPIHQISALPNPFLPFCGLKINFNVPKGIFSIIIGLIISGTVYLIKARIKNYWEKKSVVEIFKDGDYLWKLVCYLWSGGPPEKFLVFVKMLLSDPKKTMEVLELYVARRLMLENTTSKENDDTVANGNDMESGKPEDNEESVTCFPPLEKTMSILSKLYSSLSSDVVIVLAQEAVDVCCLSIQKASQKVAKQSSVMDGQLFLLKNLHILLDQIGPLDTTFSVMHMELDFVPLLELEKTTREEFIMSVTNLVVGPLKKLDAALAKPLKDQAVTSPELIDLDFDSPEEVAEIVQKVSQEELAKPLKDQAVTSPELIDQDFDSPGEVAEIVQKVSREELPKPIKDEVAVIVQKVSLEELPKPLKDQAVTSPELVDQDFVSPDQVAEIVQKVSQEELAKVIAKMKLYLPNPSTRTMLIKQIRTKIVEAFIESGFSSSEFARFRSTTRQSGVDQTFVFQ